MAVDLATLMGRTSDTLAAAGIGEARLETSLLIRHVTGLGRLEALTRPDTAVGWTEAAAVAGLAVRRAQGEPMAYLTGRREFWGLQFSVSDQTLIPRPDSETLIEAAVARRDTLPENLRILDLGTGSGCLLLSLLSEFPGATGIGIDINSEAVALARSNAGQLGLAGRAMFAVANWSDSLREDGGYHIVISNPPYIATNEWEGLSNTVRAFEPAQALLGGTDGLDACREIAARLPVLLADNGIATLEIGPLQADTVQKILAARGLRPTPPLPDLAGNNRCIIATHLET